MKIFKTGQVKEIDKYTIENEPITSVNLMERAAVQLSNWIVSKYESDRPVVVFAGPGNNGGDGIAVARLLSGKGFSVRVCLVRISPRLSKDAQTNLERLRKETGAEVHDLLEGDPFPRLPESALIIDALFGSGLTRPLEGFVGTFVKDINRLPNTRIAIDIPSGLFGEDNSKNKHDSIFRADYTLTLQFPKISFFFAENEEYTGEWHVLPIGLHPAAIADTTTPYQWLEAEMIRDLFPARKKFSHKGTFGHALIVAGSYGMMGAAVLAARAGIRGGTGLITAHIPRSGYPIIQSSVPEALVSLDESDIFFTEVPDIGTYNAIAAGPGLAQRTNTQKGLQDLLERAEVPLVLDADALNIISKNPRLLELTRDKAIFTPHPGEFDRLAGPSETGYQRHLKQLDYAKKHKLIIVLKGAYTSIALPDGMYYFNSTGNPGMATGGSGDVLTGLIVSLLSRGLSMAAAAMAGVYIHGLAGDLAARQTTFEGLVAGDITDNLGKAFKALDL